MEDSGGLQLNIIASKAPTKKVKEKQNYSNKKSIDINVVKKPQLEGKTIARKRPISKISNDGEKSQQFSLLKQQTELPTKVTKVTLEQKLNSPNKPEGFRDRKKFKNDKFRKRDASPTNEESKGPTTFSKVKALFRNNPEIPVIGQRHVRPVDEKLFSGKNFTDLNIHSHQVANLEKNLGLKQLTVVQQKATPVILQGRDVLVRSQTGSGKTLAYGLPIVEALQAIRPKIKRQDGVKALIIVPTRELALQTYELFVKLVYPFQWIVPGYLIGGEKRKAEKNRIKKGINILIGTPGRVCDHLQQTHSLKLNGTKCLILDEADRLFDMGYEKDVGNIVETLEKHKRNASYDPMALMRETMKATHVKFDDEDENKEEKPTEENTVEYNHELTKVFLSEKRSTVLLSATLTKAVQSLAGLTMVDPVFIDASDGRALIADSLPVQKIEQPEKVEDEDKGLEIVAQEDTDNSEESSEDSDDDEEDEKKKVQVYKGLPQFRGTKSLDAKSEKTPAIKSVLKDFGKKDDDDSDSDYDFFEALKKESKAATVVETEISTEAGDCENPFQNAIQNAIAQDEMIVPASVDQIYVVTPMKLRLVTLCSIIIDRCVTPGNGKVVVFMATQDMIDYHCELLSRVLTGKKPQSFTALREDTFKKIKEKKLKKKRKMEGDEDTEEEDKEEEEEKEDKPEEKKAEDTNDDYDEMTLLQWEEKMREKQAFVDVDFLQLHGSMDQRTRTQVFKTFRKANSGVLLCTDVAARGLDLPHVDCIIQYTGPISATDYVHRVGRTARAGNVGTAIMMLLPSEVQFVRQLEERRIRLHQEEMEKYHSALIGKGESQQFKKFKRGGPPPEQEAAADLQFACEELLEADKELHMKACKAFTSWMRFYSTYPREARAAFDRKAIHAGHAARALAIRNTPKEIAKAAPAQETKKKSTDLTWKKEAEGNVEPAPKVQKSKLSVKATNRERRQILDEFSSGLEPLKKKKKKQND